MDPQVVACVVGAFVVLVLAMSLLNLVESRRTRRMVEALLRRGPLVATAAPAPGIPAASGDPPGVARTTVAPALAGKPERQPLDPSEPGPMPDYAAQAQRPAPDADEADSEPHVAVAPRPSEPVNACDPGIVAAGLGQRPSFGRERHRDRPPPRGPSLLNGLAGAPLERPRSDATRAAREFAMRSRGGTLPSMQAAAAPSTHRAPSVDVVETSTTGETPALAPRG